MIGDCGCLRTLSTSNSNGKIVIFQPKRDSQKLRSERNSDLQINNYQCFYASGVPSKPLTSDLMETLDLFLEGLSIIETRPTDKMKRRL